MKYHVLTPHGVVRSTCSTREAAVARAQQLGPGYTIRRVAKAPKLPPVEPAEPRKSRSGTRWTDEQRAERGEARLSLRLPAESKALLERLAAERVWSLTRLICWMAEREQMKAHIPRSSDP